MPTVISRKTGEIISATEFTQEQSNQAHGIMLTGEAKLHPERFGFQEAELIKKRKGN